MAQTGQHPTIQPLLLKHQLNLKFQLACSLTTIACGRCSLVTNWGEVFGRSFRAIERYALSRVAACFSLLLFWLVPIMSPIHLSLLFVCVWIAEKEVQFEARDLLPIVFLALQ